MDPEPTLKEIALANKQQALQDELIALLNYQIAQSNTEIACLQLEIICEMEAGMTQESLAYETYMARMSTLEARSVSLKKDKRVAKEVSAAMQAKIGELRDKLPTT